MHRVVNLQSAGYDKTVIANHKNTIKDKLTNEGYDINVSEVNDGFNMENNPTLGVNVDFNNTTEANNFHDWLKQYIQNNSSDFSFARTRIHDCNHAADKNEPCNIGDVWSL